MYANESGNQENFIKVQNNLRFIEPLMTQNHRLQLLPLPEIKSLYELPKFSLEEARELFFVLNDAEEKELSLCRSNETKLYFLLQLGYFKATQQFYSFCFEDVTDDIKYLLNTYFQKKKLSSLKGKISNQSILRQRQKITTLHKYQQWDANTKNLVEKRLSQLMSTHPRNQDAFRELLAFCNFHKIVIPSYRTFQDIFSKVITQERNRLTKLSSRLLSQNMKRSLDNILETEDTISQLTLLKKDQRNFSFTALRKEIGKLNIANMLELSAKL